VLEGRMEGSRPRDRPRIGMLDGLMEGETYSIMKKGDEWKGWLPRTCH